MVDRNSPLSSVLKPGRYGTANDDRYIRLKEISCLELAEVSAWPDTWAEIKRAIGKKLKVAWPRDCRKAAINGNILTFQIAPHRYWLVSTNGDDICTSLSAVSDNKTAVFSDLGHSRVVIRVWGPGASELLMRGLPLDLDVSRFAENAFAQSAIHHMSVLVHRADVEVFDLYVGRSFAVSLGEWLTDAAESFGYQVE